MTAPSPLTVVFRIGSASLVLGRMNLRAMRPVLADLEALRSVKSNAIPNTTQLDSMLRIIAASARVVNAAATDEEIAALFLDAEIDATDALIKVSEAFTAVSTMSVPAQMGDAPQGEAASL